MISALLVEVSRSGGGCSDGAGAGDGVGSRVVVAAGERTVDAGENFAAAVAVGADDDAVGVEEVGDGGSFAKELGVGDDVEEMAGDAVALHGARDPLVGVDGDGALFDDDLIAGEGAGDLAGDGFDVGEIGVAGLALRGADGDEDGLALAGGLGEIGHEADLGVAVPFEQLGQVVLVDERVAGLQGGDFALIIIDTDDIVAHLGETDGCNQAYISGSDDGNFDVFVHSDAVLVLIVKNSRSLTDCRVSGRSEPF